MTELMIQTQPQASLAAIVAHVAAVMGMADDAQPVGLLPQPILPTAVYDEDAATRITGTAYETRYRAAKAGKLTVRRVGSRRMYLGSDLLTWLKGEQK